jgi:predicted enzyme related to lactoylglutathione lyase
MPKKKARRAIKRAVVKKRAVKRAKARSSAATQAKNAQLGWITHTELASADPEATKAWCAKVIGWTFKPPSMTSEGPYHLFTYSQQGGGGIRHINPLELPGTIPYINVANVKAAFDRAIREGAEEMFPPTTVMEGVTIATVRAPGGVPIGLAGS